MLRDNNPKTLEEYAVQVALTIISLNTMANMERSAITSGLLPEDMHEHTTSLIWETDRLGALHAKQLEEILELLGDSFSVQEALKKIYEDMEKQ